MLITALCVFMSSCNNKENVMCSDFYTRVDYFDCTEYDTTYTEEDYKSVLDIEGIGYQELVDSYYTSKAAPDFIIRDMDEGVCIIKYIGSNPKIIIPEKIDNKPVVSIGKYHYIDHDVSETDEPFWISGVFFQECDFDIELLYIPKYVKRIASSTLDMNFMYQEHRFAKSQEHQLKKVIFDEDNPYYTVENKALYTNNKSTFLCNLNYQDSSTVKIIKKCKKISIRWNDVRLKTVEGYRGTVAEKYAKENNLKFIPLD